VIVRHAGPPSRGGAGDAAIVRDRDRTVLGVARDARAPDEGGAIVGWSNTWGARPMPPTKLGRCPERFKRSWGRELAHSDYVKNEGAHAFTKGTL